MDLHNKKILYANGCSYTCGAEIEGEEIWMSDYNLKWCFAGQIANKYNLRYLNDAEPGGSNERIVRTTTTWVSKCLKNGVKPEDIFCIIGWTNPNRIEFFYDNKWIQWLPGISGLQLYEENINNRKVGRGYKELDKYIVNYFTHEYGNFTKMIIQIILLSLFLKNLKIDFLMVNAAYAPNFGVCFEEFPELEFLFPYENFFEHFRGFHSGYRSLEIYNDHFVGNINGHPDKFLHTLYAEKLDKFIIKEL